MAIRILILATALLATSSARADATGDARAHFERGNTAFALGRYAVAAQEYEQAFALHSDPALLYNAAQAHRMANNKARALVLYQNYLRVFGFKVTNRDEVQRHITTLKQAIDSEERSRNSPPIGPTVIDGLHPETRPTPPEKPLPPPSRAKLYAGAGILAGGVAVLVAGGALLGVAHSAADEINHPAPGYVFRPDTEAAVKTDQTAGVALLAIGGAAIATGVVLTALGARDVRERPRLTVLPYGGPAGAGMVATFGF